MAAYEEPNVPDVRHTDIVVGIDGSSSAKAALRWALPVVVVRGRT